MNSLSRRESNWTVMPLSRSESVLWADTLLESGLAGGGDAAAMGTRLVPTSHGSAGSRLGATRSTP